MTDPLKGVPVDHVVAGIHISGWRASQFPDRLRAAGITHVLKLFDGPPFFPGDFVTHECAIDDGEFIPKAVLEDGVQFVMEQVEAQQPVLVMCGAGISRSATFVLGAMLRLGYDLRAAFDVLRAAHPAAAPHPRLWLSLIEHFDLSYSVEETWEWTLQDDE